MLSLLSFYRDVSRLTCILLILTVGFIISAFFLPVEYSFENHFLENLEIVILFIGFMISFYKIRASEMYITGKFYIACCIIYVLMILRELSWGRVFYPVGVGSDGQQIFVSIHELWYGSVVYPILTVLLLIVLALFIYFFWQAAHMRVQCRVPLWEFLIFAVMGIISQCVFDRGMIDFLDAYNQQLEECTETIAYIALVFCTYQVSFRKNYIHLRYFHMY